MTNQSILSRIARRSKRVLGNWLPVSATGHSMHRRDAPNSATEKGTPVGLVSHLLERRWPKPATAGLHSYRPNIIIGGVGHAGTSMAARMLSSLGWRLPGVASDERYCEHVEFRDLNREAFLSQSFPAAAARTCLSSLGDGWCVKEPQFVFGWQYWMPLLEELELNPFLIVLTKDYGQLAKSYLRRGAANAKNSKLLARRSLEAADAMLADWPWGKISLRYEDLEAAAAIYDPQMKFGRCEEH